jgi:hypothetical protein
MATGGWVQDFKKKDKLRHMTRYISSKENATFEETVKHPGLFKKQTITIIPNHSFLVCSISE